jgi:hypothetical protein
MSKNFLASTKVSRFDLGDGYWVSLKNEMSYGDNQALTASYMNLQSRLLNPKGETPVKFDLGNITLMRLNIVEWNLTGEDGKVLPLADDVFHSLQIPVAKAIVAEIQRRNPVPKV